MRTRSLRRGSAIIEALIATVLLATTGIGLVTLLRQTGHSLRSVRTSERQIRDASESLDHLVLLGRADVLARQGQTPFAGWSLSITAAGSGLFDVSIAESDNGAPLLRTTIYRSDTTNEQQ